MRNSGRHKCVFKVQFYKIENLTKYMFEYEYFVGMFRSDPLILPLAWVWWPRRLTQ